MVANFSSVTPNRKPKVPSRAPSPVKPKRSALVPSETDNNDPLPRRPKCRDVTSRYLSSIASSASNATTMTSTSSSGSFSSATTTSSGDSAVGYGEDVDDDAGEEFVSFVSRSVVCDSGK
ncbi:hypothetical protein Hanom_Chr09g00820911 [Helianthus anomalus]